MIITGEKAYLKSYDPKLHNDAAMNNQISNSAKIQNDNKKKQQSKKKRKQRRQQRHIQKYKKQSEHTFTRP